MRVQAPLDPDLVNACGSQPSNACKWAFDATGNGGLSSAVDFLVAQPLQILLILVIAYLANRVARRMINRFSAKLAGSVASGRLKQVVDRTPAMLLPTGEINLRSEARAKTVAAVLKSLASVLIYSFALVYILDVIGLQLGPLIAGAGILGIALGFGAQSLVRDFLSGIFILIEDQYGVGDIIDVGNGVGGAVEEVSLRVTRMRDVNGTVWHVPNGEIRKVGNKSQQWARAVLDLELAFGTDIEAAQALIVRVADDLCSGPDLAGEILEAPELWGVESLTPEGITERLVVKTRPGSQFRVMRRLRERLAEEFEAAGIELSGAAASVYVRKDLAEKAAAEARAAGAAEARAAAAQRSPTVR